MSIYLDESYIEFTYDLYFALRMVQSKEHMSDLSDDDD